MKSIATLTMSVAVVCLASSPLLAADGVLISEKTTTGGKTEAHQIQIDQNRIRVETSGRNGEKQAFVFDGTKQIMWMIDYDKKTYSEITKDDVDRLGGQMSDAMSQMQAQLQSMPPEQRARIEAMMKSRMPPGAGAAVAKTEYKATGKGQAGKWACEQYEGYRDGQKTVEMCTVDPKALGFSTADFAVSAELKAFFSKLMPQGSDNMFSIGKLEEQGFSGVPVHRASFGMRPTTTDITDVTRQSFPDSTFAVPDGFQKVASPFAGRGGRGPGR